METRYKFNLRLNYIYFTMHPKKQGLNSDNSCLKIISKQANLFFYPVNGYLYDIC